MSDGSQLRKSWYDSLNSAESHFRRLLSSSSSSDWKRVVYASDSPSSGKGKARAVPEPDLTDVVVHRKATRTSGDVYRLVLDVATGDDVVSLEPWRAVLSTPELRQAWDPAVEEAHVLETVDPATRICKTNYTLGWPANPRDAVTISRLFHDASTVIDISTSLPRSPDEPAYLRPSPPYVRSTVTLFAWCIQYIQPQPVSSEDQPKRKGRLRITCFWQHDLRTAWSFVSSSALAQQLCTMALGLFKTVAKRGARVPMLVGYGNGVTIERVRFQIDREALTVDYAVIPEDSDHSGNEHAPGLDELHALREHRRLTRAVECFLPSSEGWDVQMSTKASSTEVEQLPWAADAYRHSGPSNTLQGPGHIVLRLSHAPLLDDHSVLKVRVVVETSDPTSGLRLNGLPHTIRNVEDRDPVMQQQPILQDVASAADVSFTTTSSMRTGSSAASTSTSVIRQPSQTQRTVAADKGILSRVRRNYIYFSSLLQEPEAKWKRTTEARGVSITQLDSIDPTLVVYRAEATFVGVGMWDLYSALVSPGAKIYWDKQHEDAVLLEDVNELTELWHFKTRPAWPVNGRDAVVLKTVYKSPTTIHVFSFSADDPHLFPSIPLVDPTVIRTQVDLQGWAIEALSPTTTLLTLLEQSDPKGWTTKTAIPVQMISALAGIGEFAIKCGGPPVVTRLAGAKANELRYDHERGSFRIEYEGSVSRRVSAEMNQGTGVASPGMSMVECEIRCDVDTWASSLDIVVDPPPQTISCLRRHRLSSEGGGLWLTLGHDAQFVDDERLLAIVRRAPGKERGLVMVNGARVNVDVEELPEHEIKSLTKRKRVKPPRIPLDQPPVMGVIRRRRAEWDADAEGSEEKTGEKSGGGWVTAPRISPLTRFFSYAVDQAATTTQQAVAAMSPATAARDASLSPSKPPMRYALEALAWMQESHPRFSSEGWAVVSDKGLLIHRKLCSEISLAIPVHKGEKVIEGVSAEELACVVAEYDCRRRWDERFDTGTVLESFGAECRTSFVVCKGGFPFRDRGFYLASVMARSQVAAAARRGAPGEVGEPSAGGARSAVFCVSASFSPDSVPSFAPAKVNPYALPIGRVFIDGWILETLDPYTTENYAIPSARCTRVIAVDYGGSIPAAVNSSINATLPKSILAMEAYIKGIVPLPITRLPAPGLVITEKRFDEPFAEASLSWKLRKRDEHRTLVSTKFNPEERIYRSTMVVVIPPSTRSSPRPELSQTTPRPSRMKLSPPASPGPEGQPQQSSTPVASAQGTDAVSSRTTLDMTPHMRSTSSAFTLKGEVRPATDLLVGEIVVDSRLYPDGYDVGLRSRMRGNAKHVSLRFSSPTDTTATTTVTTTATTTTGDANGEIGNGGMNADEENVLPLMYTVHTLPSTPLHSADRPTRHLVRMTLPTAQYEISTVQDPLTGETRSAPPRPTWLLALSERGAVVEVVVRPGSTVGSDTKGKEVEGRKMVVRIGGKEVDVVGEKESLTSLGREELLDDRVGKMSVLMRVADEADSLPDDLLAPVGIAEDLLDPAVTISQATTEESKEADAPSTTSGNSEETPSIHPVDATTQAPIARTASGGLLGFLHSYQNPLSRFTSSATTSTSITGPGPLTLPSVSASASASRRNSGILTPDVIPGGFGDVESTWARPLYPLSTLVIIALISFLIGSLLRSLLSPADFIYVVTDLREAEEANGGWREIRRLLEVKYLIGGWDFQISVVRRP